MSMVRQRCKVRAGQDLLEHQPQQVLKSKRKKVGPLRLSRDACGNVDTSHLKREHTAIPDTFSKLGEQTMEHNQKHTLEFFFKKTRSISTGSKESSTSVIAINESSSGRPRGSLSEIDEESNDSFETKISSEISENNGFISCDISRSELFELKNNSNNIFLQEPVLKLDIDKSIKLASSIKRSKCLDVGELFTQTSDKKFNCHSIESDLYGFSGECKDIFYIEADNDYSDSGETSSSKGLIASTADEASSHQRTPRKPVTPHRILCPSPLKYKTSSDSSCSKECKSRRKLSHVDDHEHTTKLTQAECYKAEKHKVLIKDGTCQTVDKKLPVFSCNSKSDKITISSKAKKPKKQTSGHRQLTEFFPVRRSVRKPLGIVKKELMSKLERAIIEEQCDGLAVAFIDGKGRGVIANRFFERGDFVIEYAGDLISPAEATKREKLYALDENAGCYMYYFKHNNQRYCIDATVDSGKLGRLVNHSRNGNLITKIVEIKQRPHLVLLAKDQIKPGEELCYDYGDRSKESLIHHPWLAY